MKLWKDWVIDEVILLIEIFFQGIDLEQVRQKVGSIFPGINFHPRLPNINFDPCNISRCRCRILKQTPYKWGM
jgi:hypothetical protein